MNSRINWSALCFLTLSITIVAGAQTLRDAADAGGKFVGAAVNMSPFRNETAYTQTLGREFNMLVAENAMKFDAIHPAQNTYNFTDADALVAYAEANNMAVRGHTLVWHNQLPGWLTGGNFTRDQVIAIMRDHIMTVVGRYRGRILAWDVVNEAVSDNNGQLRTDSFWSQRIGPEYIAMAFQFARQADPSAILYYNDYSAEGAGAKSDAVFNLVSGLLNQGVPIDGVGWQTHMINPFRIQQAHIANAQRIAALGLELSITEADIRIALPTSSQELSEQALGFGDIAQFCLSQPNCRAVVTWGFTDKYSWVPSVFNGFGDALIFDANYQPKPAYTAMLNAFGGGPPPTPNFTLAAAPSGLSVNRGASGTSTITITRSGGFTSAVALSATGAPAGVTATFNPASATGTSSVLTFAASATATLGAATVTVTGTGGGLTRTATISLTVNQPQQTPNFTLSANPASLTVNSGASGTVAVAITRSGGFTGAVALSATGLPAGVTAAFSPASTTGTSSVLTLTASATAAAGPATITVTGTGGNLTRTATISLTVNGGGGGGTGGVTITPAIIANGPWYNEQVVRLNNTGAITALSVTIVVQRTTGVGFNGMYNTVGGQIQQSNTVAATTITYQFTLAPGQTLGPGTNRTFAAQMSGAGTVHPTSGDTYTITYTIGGASFTQTGQF
jgi:endo-1,4-beta-xylanase